MFELFLIFALLAAVLFWRSRFGFEAQRPSDYADTTPVADLRTHLNGPIDCEGVIYGPTGRVTSRFTAEFTGAWDGATGTLAEEFVYDTGTTQSRKWFLTMGEDGHFTATADDIIGVATGRQAGTCCECRDDELCLHERSPLLFV